MWHIIKIGIRFKKGCFNIFTGLHFAQSLEAKANGLNIMLMIDIIHCVTSRLPNSTFYFKKGSYLNKNDSSMCNHYMFLKPRKNIIICNQLHILACVNQRKRRYGISFGNDIRLSLTCPVFLFIILDSVVLLIKQNLHL